MPPPLRVLPLLVLLGARPAPPVSGPAAHPDSNSAGGEAPTNLQLGYMPGPVRGVDMARPHHFSWQVGVPIGGGNTDEVASTDRKIRDALAETRRLETKAQKTDDDDGVDAGVDAVEEHQFCPAIHLTGTLGDPKNSYGDFQNRNLEKSHRTSGPPRSDLRPDS